MAGDRRRGPRKGVEQFSLSGAQHVYRKPYRRGGRWRVNRRSRETGHIEQVTLTVLASELGFDEPEPRGLRGAKDLLERLVDEEKRRARQPGETEDRQVVGVTVRQAFDEWIQTLDVRAPTMFDYKASVDMYVRELGEDRLVSELTLQSVEGLFFGSWKSLTGRTKLKHLHMLRRFFAYASQRGKRYCRENLAEQITAPKSWAKQVRKAKRETGTALTHEEQVALLQSCGGPYQVDTTPKSKRETRKTENFFVVYPPEYLWLFVFLSLRTGLRSSNLLGSDTKPALRWQDVDLKKKTLSLDAALMKNDEPFHIPLHDEVAEILTAHRKTLERLPKKNDAIIRGAPKDIKRGFHGALKRAKLPRIRIHDLRHSFSTTLGLVAPHAALKRLAGHTMTDISDVYAMRMGIEDLREILNRLPRLLPKGTRPPTLKAVSSA